MHSRVSFIQLRSTLPASMRALGKKLRDRCMHSLLGIDAFILQGYDILRLSHDANARPLGLLTWDVHERLHNWLDKAPRRALTPVVWQLWGQLVVLNIKQVYSPHTVRYPRADLARLDQYLRCIAALLPEQLMVQAQCTDDLDNHWVPVYEELVEVLRCFSKPDSEKYRSNLFLRDFITGYGWDPRALLEQLQRIEGFCPQGATNQRHALLRNLLPLLLETNWKPEYSDVFSGFWEAHQRVWWGQHRKYEKSMRDAVVCRLYDVFPEHRLHAVAFVARTMDTFDAQSMPLVFPLFSGPIQEQNHGRILEVSCQILKLLAKESASKRSFFADCLRAHHCDWAAIFDMHFLLCASIPCALQSQVELLRAVAGLLDGQGMKSPESMQRDVLDIQGTPDLFG